LMEDQAIAIYQEHFWLPSRVRELKTDLRHHYFDHCVNAGQRNGVRVLQQACSKASLNGADGNPVDVDGLIGTNTISAANRLLVGLLRQERLLYYHDLVERKPELGRYLKGWSLRVARI